MAIMTRGVTAPADFKADEFTSLVNTEGVRVDCTDVVSYKTFPRAINTMLLQSHLCFAPASAT